MSKTFNLSYMVARWLKTPMSSLKQFSGVMHYQNFKLICTFDEDLEHGDDKTDFADVETEPQIRTVPLQDLLQSCPGSDLGCASG